MLDVYATFARDHLADAGFHRRKSAGERFPGAVDTLASKRWCRTARRSRPARRISSGRILPRPAESNSQSREGKQEFAWTTSWGVSTRLIGTVIMAHADDDGLVLPPRIAPTQIVILPITPKEETRGTSWRHAIAWRSELRAQRYDDAAIEVEVDQRDIRGGRRIGNGSRKACRSASRSGRATSRTGRSPSAAATTGERERNRVPGRDRRASGRRFSARSRTLYERALAFRDEHTRVIDSKEEFYAFFTPKNSEQAGDPRRLRARALERLGRGRGKIKNDLKVTIRCIPRETQRSRGNASSPGNQAPNG